MAQVSAVAATFNIHAGIDGYGRRFDVVAACSELAPDILFLEEVFAPDGGVSQATEVAEALGLFCVELPLARAQRILEPPGETPDAWEPRRPYPRAARALRVGKAVSRSSPYSYENGTWGIAVLTRERPVRDEASELGRLKRDVTVRAAIRLELGSGLVVVGTHMAHATHGSPRHLPRLRQLLPGREVPGLIGGDMNFWGPPVELALPGWRRAAKAKTWPAGRPRHQLDHLLVTPPVEALSGGAVRAGNSDHLPLRVEIAFQSTPQLD